jgi:hypothetical protein
MVIELSLVIIIIKKHWRGVGGLVFLFEKGSMSLLARHGMT